MVYPFTLYDLPEGFVLVTDYQQLFKLRRYKRKFEPSNLIRRTGMILFTYSEIHDKYYKRILSTFTGEEMLKTMIARKVLYYKPTEDAES